MTREMPARPEIFSGWKEIANYLAKGVRTVQRYERELNLPIHRPAGKSAGAVIATKAELDAWVTASPVRRDSAHRWPTARTNKIGAEFLLIDSEIALTFSGLALGSRDPEKRNIRTRTARKAYDTITHLRKGIKLTDAEQSKLDANLNRLKSELRTLGQTF
jgi:hypothetical protein